MKRAEFAMKMLVTHSDFPLLCEQANSGTSAEREHAFEKILELYRELFALIGESDKEKDFQCQLDEVFTDYELLTLSVKYPLKINPFEVMEFYINSFSN